MPLNCYGSTISRDLARAGQILVAFLVVIGVVTAAIPDALAVEQQKSDAVFPGKEWTRKSPEQVDMSEEFLGALAKLVGGHGCVVRGGVLVFSWGDITKSGDIASAFKPILSLLLLLAVQDGTLANVDAKVADVVPELGQLNSGKDGEITWRHLASQTSGYGLQELPGKAYAYNDFALALYYDALTHGVFKKDGSAILKERLGEPLGFQDRYTFDAFGPKDRPGRLAISVRDLARIGLLVQRCGKWHDKQIVRPELLKIALNSPIPTDLPRSAGKDAPMLPKQRTVGGGKNQTPLGPGFYSFNWWINGTDKNGRRLFADLPPDAIAAMGHGGERALWIIPSLDLVVAWNDSTINDFDASPGNAPTKINEAVRLMRNAAARPTKK